MGIYERFFRRDEEIQAEVEALADEEAVEFQEFAGTRFYPKLIEWFEREALKPAPVGEHMEMIKASVRANTFKEIREWLLVKQRRAGARLRPEME